MAENDSRQKIAVIAGAGPAGLTAALELLRRSHILPVVFEADSQVGGISKTINYRGNRMDLGGHRFFSKSDWVMKWWQEILPVEADPAGGNEALRIAYQRQSHDLIPEKRKPSYADEVMLVRQRLSRIFYRRRYFDYPLKLNASTLPQDGASFLKGGVPRQRFILCRSISHNRLTSFFDSSNEGPFGS